MEYKIKCLCNVGLQGQQLSAQGTTLGNSNRQMCNSPCKGKSTNLFIKLFPLQGAFYSHQQNPGRCLRLWVHWLEYFSLSRIRELGCFERDKFLNSWFYMWWGFVSFGRFLFVHLRESCQRPTDQREVIIDDAIESKSSKMYSVGDISYHEFENFIFCKAEKL